MTADQIIMELFDRNGTAEDLDRSIVNAVTVLANAPEPPLFAEVKSPRCNALVCYNDNPLGEWLSIFYQTMNKSNRQFIRGELKRQGITVRQWDSDRLSEYFNEKYNID